MWPLCLILMTAAQLQPEPFTSPTPAAAEYGRGLSADEARAGWIALYDGQTTYGWADSTVDSGRISGGQTTGPFGNGDLKGELLSGGLITIGDQVLKMDAGPFQRAVQLGKSDRIALGPGVRVKSLQFKPSKLNKVWNGHDLTGWTILKHPKLPADRQTKWTVAEGTLQAVGGPGAVELEGKYGDLVLQIEVRMRAKLVNGGLFLRSVPSQFMNGYEAQLFNGCYKQDPAQPARYSTGAIDDRLLARRLVSRDLEPFTMTVIAVGPHIATWVNGYQTVDWTDTRAAHENPREGLRLEPGTIQLQAHDPETDIEFRRVEIAEIK